LTGEGSRSENAGRGGARYGAGVIKIENYDGAAAGLRIFGK